MSIVPALSLGALALGIIAWIAGALFSPLAGDTRGLADKLRFRSKERAAREADLSLEREDWTGALKHIQESFFLDHIRSDADLIERAGNLHLGLLSRVLIIAEKRNLQVQNIAVVEDLLLTRAELMRSYFEAASSRTNLAKRRERKTPGWALDEYRRRLDEIKDRLDTNRRSLESQLHIIFRLLREEHPRDEVTYH